MTENITEVKVGQRTFYLLGTAHVSSESVAEVRQSIEEMELDRVCVELDEGRFQNLTEKQSWENLDLVQIFKQKKGFLLLANLILSSYQRKIGKDMGVSPGMEMKEAIEAAREKELPFSLIDRDVRVTLNRAWRKSGLWGKSKLMATMLSSAFGEEEEVSQEQIEELKARSELDTMMAEMGKEFPKVKEILIDERDQYLATKLFEAQGEKILAVVGAGHVPGMIRYLESFAQEEPEGLNEISQVPPKSWISKILPWLIPAAVIGLLTAGFIAGPENGWSGFLTWVIWNGALTALGGIVSLAHPLTILAAAASAPFTSLVPVVGVGFVSGPLQALLNRPQVKDFENLHDQSAKFTGWYKNRVLRTLLVFLLTSLGSAVATWIGTPALITNLLGS